MAKKGISKETSEEKPKKTVFLPSLKENKRYLIVHVSAKSEKKVKEAIDRAILNLIGTLGYAKACPIIIEIKKISNNLFYSILSINRGYVDNVKAAFAFFGIKCIGVSGSIKQGRRFI